MQECCKTLSVGVKAKREEWRVEWRWVILRCWCTWPLSLFAAQHLQTQTMTLTKSKEAQVEQQSKLHYYAQTRITCMNGTATSVLFTLLDLRLFACVGKQQTEREEKRGIVEGWPISTPVLDRTHMSLSVIICGLIRLQLPCVVHYCYQGEKM